MLIAVMMVELRKVKMIVKQLMDILDDAIWFNIAMDQGIQLIDDEIKGSLQSKPLTVDPCHKMVLSWNTTTREKNGVEVKIRVKHQCWGPWLSYGMWSTHGQSTGSIRYEKSDHAWLDIDEVCDEEEMTIIQLRIDFYRQNRFYPSPVLHDVFVSIDKKEKSHLLNVPNIDIEVPEVSQMMLSEIGNIACSPTALTMILNYYGHAISALDTAKSCFDNGEGIYGNWAYNVAFAGECGFEAYVDYCDDVGRLIQYVQQGMPVVVSVKSNVMITGAPQAYPEGHLLVVRGFLNEDIPYVIVNDPASRSQEEVKRYYQLSEFLSIWRRVIYVIKTKGRNNV